MLLIIIVVIGILLFEVPSLLKKKMWRELAVFMGLLFIATFYSIGQVMRLDVPNPTDLLEFIYGPVAETIEVLLTPEE